MGMIAERLHIGDTIGVVSPSSPVQPGLIGQLEHGVNFLESMGFHVLLGEHVDSTSWGYAASPREKAQDINRMFSDPSVKAVICSQGGATANACLPHLDWKAIQAAPKIFLGISDITVLLNAIHHRTGLVTFHGNDVIWGFGRAPTEYDRQEFIRCVVDAEIGPIPPNRERCTIRAGRAAGRLLGGNLNCLLKLAGTPWFPDLTGAILFLEAIGVTAQDCDALFQQLEQMGVLKRIIGAVIGHIDGLQNDEQAVMQMEDVLLRLTAAEHFPILKVEDFGHNCPNTVLPVGGRVEIDAGARTIAILEKCLR